MPLAAVIAGPYTGAWNSVSVGITEDGFRLRQTVNKELVRGDLYGESVIESVYRGGDCFLTYTGIEYESVVKVAAISPFWPYGAGIGKMGVVGRVDTDATLALSKATVLTAVAGTTAATKPATLTASLSIIDENFNAELMFAARARKVPITLRLYPSDVGGGVISWFTVT